MMTDRRKSPRRRSFLGARISFNQQCSTLNCVVRNLSLDGALVQIPDVVALPGAFSLEIPQQQRVYSARVCWRNADSFGIAFAPRPNDADEAKPLDLARRLQRCEQDNARLKTRILQLDGSG